MSVANVDIYSPIVQVLLSHAVETEQGCWEWQGPKRKGYGRIMVAGHNYSVHRLIYMDVIGPIPAGHVVMHRCDNPPCCRPGHLKAGTQAENLADMEIKGRRHRVPAKPKIVKAPRAPKPKKEPLGQVFGSRHGNSKLSDEAVRDIRAQVGAGISQSELARRYGVHQSQISRALNGRLWSHV